MKELTVLFLFISCVSFAQKVTLKGTIKEKATSQSLPLAHVLVLPDSLSTVADSKGVFTISLQPGNKTIIISYVGYSTARHNVRVMRDVTMDFSLQTSISELDEVIVNSTRFLNEDMLKSTRTSTNKITSEDIGAIPVLGGEADVIKTLQLLPGTVRGVEGSSDLFVRGGAADQNLVLLDGAAVYNTSHLFGFLSVFNPDVISEVEAINGGFPAQYGGRLSSILNVRTRNTIPERTHASADIGLIASRLFIEQPLMKDKASIWLSGRRTYIDQVVKAVNLDLPYYFYDLNGKLLLKPTSRDKIEIAHYSGDDRLDYLRDRNGDGVGQTTGYHSGNNSQTVHWNRNYTKWSHDITLFRTRYRYDVHTQFRENGILAFSDIHDLGGKVQFMNDSLPNNGSLYLGGEVTHHTLSPNVVNTSGTIAELLKSSSSRGRVAIEAAAFAQYEMQPLPKVRVSAGIRGSTAIVDNTTYFNPEPRLAVRYLLNERSSVKASYSRMAQYLHRVSSSAISSPTDIWYPVTDSIKPQVADQVGIAYQRALPKYNAMFSVETYYKKMHQLVGYEEGTNLFFNTDFESSLIQGEGKAYGFEFLVRKQSGKFTGWINYTLSWSWRRYNSINNGEWFHARYDRRHNGAVVLQYAFAKRWAASMVWEYISGSRFTPVIGQYAITSPSLTGIDLVPVYAPINSVRLSDAHRLDAGVKFKSKPGNFFQWQIFVGVYNAYNRANPVGMIVTADETTGALKYMQPGLFGLLPFVSYGIRF
ncbi:MAG TPA: TonB-dependent receptor [Cyclobacteriaceae bacterium]|nr:TonB-dependent receptor [Cyclobacteriaceae bacterium]